MTGSQKKLYLGGFASLEISKKARSFAYTLRDAGETDHAKIKLQVQAMYPNLAASVTTSNAAAPITPSAVRPSSFASLSPPMHAHQDSQPSNKIINETNKLEHFRHLVCSLC